MPTHLHSVIPKLPSRDIRATKLFYVENLGFSQVGGNYPDYVMLKRDHIELHFFHMPDLDVHENYGMCYIRVADIETLYDSLKNKNKNVKFSGSGRLEAKPWGQKEFAIIDNDHNLLTFGEQSST